MTDDTLSYSREGDPLDVLAHVVTPAVFVAGTCFPLCGRRSGGPPSA